MATKLFCDRCSSQISDGTNKYEFSLVVFDSKEIFLRERGIEDLCELCAKEIEDVLFKPCSR